MVVTLIEKQKKNKNKYNIFIDGEYAFSCYVEDFLEVGLKEGDILTSEQYNYYVNLFSLKQAQKDILKYLSYKMRTEYEVSKKLKENGYSDEIVKKLILKFKEYGYINDEIYAKLFIDEKKQMLYSKYRIINELKLKGINIDTIYDLINEHYSSEYDILKKLIMKKYKFVTEENILKIKSYLYRNGFNLDEADNVLKEIMTTWHNFEKGLK